MPVQWKNISKEQPEKGRQIAIMLPPRPYMMTYLGPEDDKKRGAPDYVWVYSEDFNFSAIQDYFKQMSEPA